MDFVICLLSRSPRAPREGREERAGRASRFEATNGITRSVGFSRREGKRLDMASRFFVVFSAFLSLHYDTALRTCDRPTIRIAIAARASVVISVTVEQTRSDGSSGVTGSVCA